MPNKFELQEMQYEFPYHFLPHLRPDGTVSRARGMNWGLEYLCYQHHVREAVLACRPRSVLEVGCGDGRFIGMLGAEVPRRVGVDLAPKAIAFAKAFHPEVEFQCSNSESLDESFDVVVAVEVLEHIPDADVSAFVKSLEQRVRPGGRLVISVPSVVRPVHRKHYRHYDESLLKAQITEAAPRLRPQKIDHVYAAPRWMDTFLRYTCNRHFVLDIGVINRFLWKRLWQQRLTAPGKGCHLVAVFGKF